MLSACWCHLSCACQLCAARRVMGAHVSVQLEVQDRVGKMADLDEQLAEMHKRLEKQLLQQLDTEELLRYSVPLMLLRWMST